MIKDSHIDFFHLASSHRLWLFVPLIGYSISLIQFCISQPTLSVIQTSPVASLIFTYLFILFAIFRINPFAYSLISNFHTFLVSCFDNYVFAN